MSTSARHNSTQRYWRIIQLYILPALLYLFVSLYFFGPPHLSDITKSLFTPSGDPESFVWYLNWWPFAIGHHLNPFISHYVWSPGGANLAWSTSVPALALIMAPVTLLLGATASFNILAILAPALSATTCYYLVRYLTKKTGPALVAGYLYGFSSYELGQLLGHMNLYFSFLAPLAALVFVMRVQERLRRASYIIWLAIIMVVRFGISTEIFTNFIIFPALAGVIFYLFADRAMRRRLVSTALESLWSLALAMLILSPYLYYLLIGYGAQPKLLNSPLIFSSDLLNYIIPTPLTRLGGSLFSNISGRYGGNFSETGAYLGVPLLLIILHYVTTHWRRAYVRALGLLLALSILASLGPRLHINGVNTGIWLPWSVATHLPVLRLLLPTRFTIYVALVAAIMVGLWLANEGSKRGLVARYAAAVLAIIFILPNTSQYYWKRVDVPPIFTKSQVSRFISKDENIVILPYGSDGHSMYYQAVSGMWFTQSGGNTGINVPKAFLPAFTWSSPEFKDQMTKFCKENHVTKIIYTKDYPEVLVQNLNLLGWPTKSQGGATVITVPHL